MARGRRIKEAPVLEAEVVDLTHEGNGVIKRAEDGKTVFVHGALPGERVRYQATYRHKNYDEGKLIERLSSSPDRVTPDCPHFELCGGCALQHLAPAAQIKFKQNMLLESLQRLGGVSPEQIMPALTGPYWNYRHKARLGVKDVPAKGRVLVGFRERSAPYIADATVCKVLAGGVGEWLEPLSDMVAKLSIRQRLPQIEVAVGDDRTALVFRVLEAPTEADKAVLLAFGAEYGTDIWLQTKGPTTAAPLNDAPELLHYELPEHDITVPFKPTDFTQINPVINRQMIAQALDLLALDGSNNVLELFSGLGNFTLPLARQAKAVTAVEGDAALVSRAEANAKALGFNNVTYRVANLYEPLDILPWGKQQFDRALIDPPRSGAKEVLPLLAAAGAKRLVYVSCHPGSLARDAGLLVKEHGYRLEKAGVMDMFPHTAHVESMALFVKD